LKIARCSSAVIDRRYSRFRCSSAVIDRRYSRFRCSSAVIDRRYRRFWHFTTGTHRLTVV